MPAPDLTTIDGTIDVYCIDDFKSTMPLVSGREALAQRLVRRITTKPGQLPFWPDDGIDVRDALLSKRRPEDIAQEVKSECLKDEQVTNIEVDAQLSNDGRDLTIKFSVTDGDAPFTFTLLIDDAKTRLVDLLNA